MTEEIQVHPVVPGVLDETIQDQIQDPIGIQVEVPDVREYSLEHLVGIRGFPQRQEDKDQLTIPFIAFLQQIVLGLREVVQSEYPPVLLIVLILINNLRLEQTSFPQLFDHVCLAYNVALSDDGEEVSEVLIGLGLGRTRVFRIGIRDQ